MSPSPRRSRSRERVVPVAKTLTQFATDIHAYLGKGKVKQARKALDLDEYRQHHWTGTFADYLDLVEGSPRVARTAFERLYDMILAAGSREYVDNKKRIKHYNFFDDPQHNGRDGIFGLELTERKNALHNIVVIQLIKLLNCHQFREGIQLLHAARVAQIDHRKQLAAANKRESLRQQEQIDSINRFLMRERARIGIGEAACWKVSDM